jgi:hypothetical protein
MCAIHRANCVFEKGEELGIILDGFGDWIVGRRKADVATIEWWGHDSH